MGLYLSAHPLDKYDTFFEEQTHPFSFITPENDGKNIVVGGIITSVRTILTKKNEKMAFIKIENKTSETEVIAFPSIYNQNIDKLAQDNVVKITGRVNAKDKNGNVSPEPKVLIDSVEVISDDVLKNYQSTGQTLPAPKSSEKSSRRFFKSSAEHVSEAKIPESTDQPVVKPKDLRSEKLYLLIKNPDDAETLTKIRKICDLNLGVQEVILVFKDNDEKRILKMPFRVEINDNLKKELTDILGEENIKVK